MDIYFELTNFNFFKTVIIYCLLTDPELSVSNTLKCLIAA